MEKFISVMIDQYKSILKNEPMSIRMNKNTLDKVIESGEFVKTDEMLLYGMKIILSKAIPDNVILVQ